MSQLRSRLTSITCMFIVLLLLFSLKQYPLLIEKYYSGRMYVSIRAGFQFVFNYVPFSVGDLVYVTIVIFFVAGAARLIRLLILKKNRSAGVLFLGFILKLEVAIGLFYLLWALNYFRQPALERLRLQNYGYNAAQLVEVTSMLIDSANAVRATLRSGELTVSNQDIIDKSVKAVKDLSSFYPAITAIKPSAKTSLLNPLLNYIGTAGYYNPFTGEAHFNSSMPIYTRPFVACHEMAHQLGFGAEDEANFAGFIAGTSSEDNLLKYSAYYLGVQEFMNEVWRTDSVSFKRLKEKISPAVAHDFETERNFWTRYHGGAARLNSIFYDKYLKANNQPGGLKTYNRMIKLSMAYFRKKGVIK